MKLTTHVATICTVASLCSATPVLVVPAVDSTTNETGQMKVTDRHHPANFDYSPIIVPMLAYLKETKKYAATPMKNSRALFNQAEHLAQSGTVDFDDVFTNAFPKTHEMPKNPDLEKRTHHYHKVPCGMETVIAEDCRNLHMCRFACIVGTNPFPYYTCSRFLINGRCPTGMMGMEQLRPPPAE